MSGFGLSAGEQYWREFFTGYLEEDHPFQGKAVSITYLYGNALTQTVETHTASQLFIDVTPNGSEECVPESLQLPLGGKTFIGMSGGIYVDVSAATGYGTYAGSMNATTGLVALTYWPAGASNAPALAALTTRVGAAICDEVVIRAPDAPVQVGSVTVTATDVDGNELMSTASNLGVFDDVGMQGKFSYAQGLGLIRFGDWVTAAGNESQPWFKSESVQAGQILRRRRVLAGSVRCSYVTIQALPVDDAMQGLSSARLKKTGRVAIYTAGQVVALHHTGTVSAATAEAGGTIDLERTGLSDVWVRDSAGKRLPVDKFTANKTTGIFTWAAPLALTGFTAPFTIYHQIMHQSKVQKVFADGRIVLRLTAQRDFPLGSLLSSELWIGDMQGHVKGSFHQNAWTYDFLSSSPNGEPDWRYDDIGFPVAVTNVSSTDSYAIVVQADTTKYKVISKNRGPLVFNVPMYSDFTLINKVTDEAEWTIFGDGFSLGAVVGNSYMFRVVGGTYPIDLCLTVAEGAEATEVDYCSIKIIGEI